MPPSYYPPYPHTPPIWPPPSPNSDVLLESQLEQIRSLGRIEAKVEPIPAMQEQVQSNTLRIVRLEDKLDSHIEDCRKPKRRFLSTDGLKENWTVVLLIVQAVTFTFLQLIGQPEKADRISFSASQSRDKSQD